MQLAIHNKKHLGAVELVCSMVLALTHSFIALTTPVIAPQHPHRLVVSVSSNHVPQCLSGRSSSRFMHA
jgi:hypothetical protein